MKTARSRCCPDATAVRKDREIFNLHKVLTAPLTRLPSGVLKGILRGRRPSMRRQLTIVGVIAALSLGSAPAFAFQEQPVPPPAAASDANAPQAKTAPLELATPGVTPSEKPDTGGGHVFG